MNDKKRVDIALVERGLADSREKAQALIMAGQVYRREVKILKPSEKVSEAEPLTVRGQAHPYVGRGALKLEKALTAFRIDVQGAVAMDIGAATGGFTDVLLQRGAKQVFAIDVGYGQLDWKIRNDSRVTVMERTNARYLEKDQIADAIDFASADVSFISLRHIVPMFARLEARELVTLIKPQFEAGREQVGKHGVVSDPKVHIEVIRAVVSMARECGYQMTNLDFSPVRGPKGNIEYIARYIYAGFGIAEQTEDNIEEVVISAHKSL